MLSLIIPAYNEAGSIRQTIQDAHDTLSAAGIVYEVIVVNDGSTDETGKLADAEGVTLIHHPSNGGYGRAIKTGVRRARYEWCAIVDADGSYPIASLVELLDYVPDFDMVVGARTGKNYWGSPSKRLARMALLLLVRFVTGVKVPDVNSGLRIFRKEFAIEHSARISSGFSFTTTLTLAMILDERFLKYVPIDYAPRVGRTKVRMRRDSLRMLQILVQAILYYNPLKLFLVLCALCLGIGIFGGLAVQLFSGSGGLFFLGIALLTGAVVAALGFCAEQIRLRGATGPRGNGQ